MTNTNLKIILVIVTLLLLWQIVMNNKNNTQTIIVNKNCDSLSILVDSFKNEAFIYSMDAARYEVALEILKEKDSTAASKYEDILYSETE
jgi:hypothetical protein